MLQNTGYRYTTKYRIPEYYRIQDIRMLKNTGYRYTTECSIQDTGKL